MSAAGRRTAWLVAGMALLGGASAALHAWVHAGTAGRIAANEHAWAMRQLNEIVPRTRYDNALIDDTVTVEEPVLLGGAGPRTIYRAFEGGRPVAAVIETVAPGGYSGAIHLLVGVNADGSVAGVRVTQHRETPGLGDRIERGKTDWVTTFDGRALGAPPAPQWAVTSDGGVFDQFTGATVTPRAVVQAVRDALLYFDAHRDEIFAADTP